jgi:starch synthase
MALRPEKNTILLGMVGRLVEHKGIKIILGALGELLKSFQLVILGEGNPSYYGPLEDMAGKFKDSFSLNIGFDEVLAHKIYAASDVFLMPSRIEPCGLSQLISYRYATVPLVHHAGGLIDTVVDYSRGGGGFVFEQYSSPALLDTLRRIQEVFSSREDWMLLLDKISRYDFSWNKSAKSYLKLYRGLLEDA